VIFGKVHTKLVSRYFAGLEKVDSPRPPAAASRIRIAKVRRQFGVQKSEGYRINILIHPGDSRTPNASALAAEKLFLSLLRTIVGHGGRKCSPAKRW